MTIVVDAELFSRGHSGTCNDAPQRRRDIFGVCQRACRPLSGGVMQRHGADVGLPLLVALDAGFLLTSESQPPPSNSGAALLLLVAVCTGANLLGRVPPRAVGYIAVSPSDAAGDAW